MDEDIATMIVMLTLILTTGGVILFRPLSKRLAELLHVMTQERLGPSSQREVAQLRELMAGVEARLGQLEERQRFTESLLESPARGAEVVRSIAAGSRTELRALEGSED